MRTIQLFKIILSLPAKIELWWFKRFSGLDTVVKNMGMLMELYPELFVLEQQGNAVLIRPRERRSDIDHVAVRLQESILTLDWGNRLAIPLNEDQTVMLIMAAREWVRGRN